MSNVLGGGSKFHLAKYKGVFISGGAVVTRLSPSGMSMKSCGGRYKGAFNFADFHKYFKEHPEWMCKKCVSRYNQMKIEAADIKKTCS